MSWGLSGASKTVIALFGASCIVLLVGDRNSLYQSLGLNAYLGLLTLITGRLVRVVAERPDDPLVARGPHVRRRAFIVASAFFFAAFVYGFIANWVVRIPLLTALWLAYVQTKPPLGDSSLPNLFLYALVPGTLILAFGARPRELGLSRPASGTFRASLACCALPAVLFVRAFAVGDMSVGRCAFIFLRNSLSAGFSEEFLFRGLVLSHLRAFMRTEWAIFWQAIAFGLFHVGSSLNEPNGVVLIAYLFATSAVPGYLLGVIAVRTRSLALPVAIHTTLGAMKSLFS